MKTKTQLIKLATMVITVIFALTQGAVTTPVRAAESLHASTLATTPAHITSDDVMNMKEILMTRGELRDYFVNIFSEYSNDSIDILSKEGKRLLEKAQGTFSLISKKNWGEIKKIAMWYKNIKYMTGDQIKKTFPAKYFKPVTVPAELSPYDLNVRYIEGCGNQCRACPLQKGPVDHCMPFPLVLQLAILADEDKITFDSCFGFEFLYWADAVYVKDSEVYADVLFADVKKVMPFSPIEKQTGYTIWKLITHGGMTNKKKVDHHIAQLNIDRFSTVGRKKFGCENIARCEIELSIDTNSVLWSEFKARAIKNLRKKDLLIDQKMKNTIREESGSVRGDVLKNEMQSGELDYRDSVIRQYVAYYKSFIREWTRNQKNTVFLRYYKSPREFRESERGEHDAVAEGVYARLIQMRKDKQLHFSLIYENAKGGAMQVLSKQALNYVSDEYADREKIWSPLLFLYRKKPFTRPINYVIVYDGSIALQLDPGFVNIKESGIELDRSDKIKIAQAIEEEEFLRNFYVRSLPRSQREMCDKIRKALDLQNKRKRLLSSPQDQEVLDKISVDLVDFLITMEFPVPLHSLRSKIIEQLVAKNVVPEYKRIPIAGLYNDKFSQEGPIYFTERFYKAA